MRFLSSFLPLLVVVATASCVPAAEGPVDESPPMPSPEGPVPALDLAVHKEAGALGTFRATFAFPGGWRPERDVLVVLAPFSRKRDREGAYDAARLFEVAEALIAGLGEGDRVNLVSYRDLLRGESWFPKEYPFVENADDLFIRPVVAFDAWKSPADAAASLAHVRERGIETVRNTSWFIELLRETAKTCAADGGRAKEIIVVADSFAAPTKSFLSGLPVKVPLPEIRLEPLDPDWTTAFFTYLRREQVHVSFIVVAQDEKPAFSETRLRRMAESTRGFYVEWLDDDAAHQRCIEHIATGLHRGLEVDFGASDANYIYTNRWCPDGTEAFVVYGRYGKPGRHTFTLGDALTGREWPFDVALPARAEAHPELEVEWAQQRLIDGVWKLATYGPDDYLAYDLWQLARRHGLALPEMLKEMPVVTEPEPVTRPRGKGRELEVPVLDEGAVLPPHSPLAELAPYDMLYVRYSRLRSALELLDMGYFYGRDTIQALGLHPDVTMIERKAQTQVCIRVSRDLTKVYEAAVAEIAQVTTGAVATGGLGDEAQAARSGAVGEGLDLCFIVRVKMPTAYRIRMNQFRRQALDDYPGTTVRRFKHEGVVVTETLGYHNVVRSYFAMFEHTPRGATKPQTFAVSGNTWASVRRVLDVHVGKVPSIVTNADFAEFRTKLPISGFADEQAGKTHAENVFVYAGGPAIQSLTDWRIEALKQEQQAVASHLQLLRNALQSYARERGVLLDGHRWPDTIIADLVEAGYLPAIPPHPGVGAYSFGPELQVFYSTRYGRLGWLTPMADLIDALGEPRYAKAELGATAAQLAWTDDVILSRAITRPDPKDFKFAVLRALAGKEMSDFSTFRELMERPGLAVAMKSRLLQYGGRGLGRSQTEIALNFLANKIKGEIKNAIGWTDEDDPFAWAGDEVSVICDAETADWQTAHVDPSIAFAVEAKDEDGAATVLRALSERPDAITRDLGPIPEIVTTAGVVTVEGWSFALLREAGPKLVVARDARFLDRTPPEVENREWRFLPTTCHALIRFDATGFNELVDTALGLYGPAAELQAQRTMARFESLYGNRVDPFRLEDVPMLDEAPRPAGSQYGIDPVERRIASDVYGLSGDFLLAGRVPEAAGIRRALGPRAVGYGAVVLHADSIEFTGAVGDPGIARWKKPSLPSSMTVSRRIRELRKTDSLRKLAGAVSNHDGYLWRLGLRGFNLDPQRFDDRLGAPIEVTPTMYRVWDARSACGGVLSGGLGDDLCCFRLWLMCLGAPESELISILTGSAVPNLITDSPAWQRSSRLVGPAVPRYEPGVATAILRSLGHIKEHGANVPGADVPRALAKLVGWSVVVQGPAIADELRVVLDGLDECKDSWSDETIEFVREQVNEYLRLIEHR